MTRFSFAALLLCAALAGTGLSAEAATGAGPVPAVGGAPAHHFVQVDLRCGRGRHFVRPHRRHGKLVRGYCARNPQPRRHILLRRRKPHQHS